MFLIHNVQKNGNVLIKYQNVYIFFVIPVLIGIYLLLIVPSPVSFLFNPDQGTQLALAQKILFGLHPFIDWPSGGYGPLVWYASAMAQWISSGALIGEVALITVGYLCAYSLFFLLLRRISGSSIVALLLLLMLLFMIPRFYKYYMVLGPALFLMTLFFYIDQRNLVRLALLAMATVFMGMLRIDFGVYGLFVSIATIYMQSFFSKEIKASQAHKLILFYIIILFAAITPWLLFVAIYADSFIAVFLNAYQLIVAVTSGGMGLSKPVFSLEHSMAKNGFAILYWFFYLFPYVAIVIWFFCRKKCSIFILMVSIFSILMFNQASYRADMSHLLQAISSQFILLASLYNIDSNVKFRFPMLCTICVIVVFSFYPYYQRFHPVSFSSKLETLRNDIHVLAYNKEELRVYFKDHLKKNEKKVWASELLNLINLNTIDGDPILVIPFSPQLYYLANRDYPTPMGLFFPGSLSVHDEKVYIDIIKDKKVPLIIDFPKFVFDRNQERNAHIFIPSLMDFIYAEYPVKYNVGPAVILAKKTLVVE